jgi:pilus assembly protein CpaB
MNRRLMTMLLSAFLVACVGSYVVYRLVARQIVSTPVRPTAKVVVATRDLEMGTLIRPGDVTTSEVPGVLPADELSKIESAVGRGVVSPIYAGEPVSDKRLARLGAGAGLAATIPPGMRACAVKVDDVIGVAGFAVPGMHVDVLVSGTAGGSGPSGPRVRTLLQNIEVLSAGKNFQKDEEGKPVEEAVVNLLVTPAQAELLSLASSNQTHMQLVLRNPIDHDIAATQGSELATLFGAPETPAPAPPVVHVPVVRRAPPPAPVSVERPAPPPPVVIEVANGSKRSEQTFGSQSKGTAQ